MRANAKFSERIKDPVTLSSWLLLLLACGFAYWPGLAGPFVFDDFGSLDDLGARGGVVDWDTFKSFVFGGNTGPTGRPLSLLTFLVDSSNWPAEAWPFKRTNLLIHMLNGVLLGVLTRQLLLAAKLDEDDARRIAMVSAGVWLLHPFLVSTTLYVVQRMAQLSALFVLAGLVSHLHFRSQVTSNRRRAYIGMSLSVSVFTVLAMLSKENGILLPLLIGVVEMTVFAAHNESLDRRWQYFFVGAPTLVIGVYLSLKVFRGDFFDVVFPRDFSGYERVLTQPRVLFDYLRHWFIPELYTAGVFQDHVIKSTSLLSPVTTVASVIGHGCLIGLAIVKRHRWPLFGLAVLFFYVAHLLESTVVSLEMYFEHRNYLATVFLFLPLIVALQKRASTGAFIAVVAVAFLTLTGFTRYSSTVWQDFPSMVHASAQKAPNSARAQVQFATNLYNDRQYSASLATLDAAIERLPHEASLQISKSTILCSMGLLNDNDFEPAAQQISSARYDPRLIQMYTALTELVVDGKCPAASMQRLRQVFTDMLEVPENGNPKSLQYSQIRYFEGWVSVRMSEPEKATEAFKGSLASRPGAGHAMQMAAILATSNYFDEALYFSGIALAEIESKSGQTLNVQRVGEDDVRMFRENVIREMEALRQDPGSVDPAQ